MEQAGGLPVGRGNLPYADYVHGGAFVAGDRAEVAADFAVGGGDAILPQRGVGAGFDLSGGLLVLSSPARVMPISVATDGSAVWLLRSLRFLEKRRPAPKLTKLALIHGNEGL